MSQSIVTIRLNGTPYQIGCGAGEEPRIEELAAEIESVVQQLVGSVGQIGEARLLAMTALIFADRAQEAAAGRARAAARPALAAVEWPRAAESRRPSARWGRAPAGGQVWRWWAM